jgi:acetyl-CoA carboxylase biotin carboxyl carrier protein
MFGLQTVVHPTVEIDMAKTPTSSKKSTNSGAASLRASGDPSDIVNTVRGLAEVVSDHGLSELIVDLPQATVTLRRGGFAGQVVHAAPSASAPVYSQVSHAPTSAPAAVVPSAVVVEKGHVVTSPFVGTFYRKPNPDAAFYINVGDKVSKGKVLCIVEAMKLMNEIEADADGVLLAVMVEDGATVEYGQPLFRIG